jgi:pimeloyl-ACP methyl ester carboxylesterase
MEEKVFFNGKFEKISGVLHSTNNKKEIAIILHGFSSNKEKGALFYAEELNKIEVNALRIDLDNQGESDLDFETGACIPNYIKQTESSIAFCNKLGYKNISLVGTSFGRLTAFATALTHPEIKRIVLRAPVIDYKENRIWLFGINKLKEFKKKGYIPYEKNNKIFKISFDLIEKSYPYSMYEHAKSVKIPTLIIQGNKDDNVNYISAKKVISYFPNARLHLIQGAGHNLGVNGDFTESLNALTNFFKD